MPRKKKKSKAGKRFSAFLSILIILIILGFISIKILVEPLLTRKIRTELNKNPDRLYDISIEDIDLNIFNASLILKKLNIEPRDTAMKLLEAGGIKSLIFAQTAKLHINNLNIIEFIKNKNLLIEKIKVENITVNYLCNPDANPPKKMETGNFEPIIPDKINSLDISYFELLNGKFQYSVIKNAKEPQFEIDSLSALIDSIEINSETILHSIPLTFTDLQIKSRYISYTPMKFYTISTSDIRFDVRDTSLVVNNFQLVPKYTREEYNRQIKYNNDWFSISVDKIIFSGLSMNELESKNVFSLNSIDIRKPDIEIYRDKRLPDAPFKYKPLITVLMKKIRRSIAIDSVWIKDGKLAYYEMSDNSDKPGKVFFDPMSMTACNVTNDTNRIKRNPHLEIDLTGRIMAKSKLNAHIDISLDRPGEYITATGNMESIGAFEFNQMVECLLPVSIKSGNIKSAEFKFKANDNVSDGSLILQYNNLEVDVMRIKDSDKKSGVFSIIANSMIRNKNLKNEDKYIIGNIHFERRKDRFIVNYLWNSIKTGIISVVVPIADKNKKNQNRTYTDSNKKRKSKTTNSKK